MYIHEIKNRPKPIVDNEELSLLPRKALIHHELKSNFNGLVMIVQKSIKEIPEKFIELAEKNCRQKYNMQEFQCKSKCYDPIKLDELSSYIVILGTQIDNVDVFEDGETITIPMKNTILYSNKKALYFGQDVVLSKHDVSVASLNDFEHELILRTRNNNHNKNFSLNYDDNNSHNKNEHIKIMNQSSVCDYFNQRPEERKIYKLLKQKSVEYELKLMIER